MSKWIKLLGVGLMSISMLLGCSSVKVSEYAQETPALDLATYFNGTIDAHGIFTDRNGKVVKRFKVVIEANWTVKDGKKLAYWMRLLPIQMAQHSAESGH